VKAASPTITTENDQKIEVLPLSENSKKKHGENYSTSSPRKVRKSEKEKFSASSPRKQSKSEKTSPSSPRRQNKEISKSVNSGSDLKIEPLGESITENTLLQAVSSPSKFTKSRTKIEPVDDQNRYSEM